MDNIGSKNITLKDVAMKCGVTSTLVSAVLRGRQANIRCSQETRDRILRVARDLDYHPNIIARSMVSGSSSIVAVCLHQPIAASSGYYAYDNLIGAISSLRPMDIEALFLPFLSHEEQCIRLRRLVEGRLVGGVITNFIKSESGALTDYLKRRDLPVVFLGSFPEPGWISVHLEDSGLHKLIKSYARSKGFKRVVRVGFEELGGEPKKFRFEMDGVTDSIIPIDDVLSRYLKDTLFDARGENVARMLVTRAGVDQRQIIAVEDSRNRPAWRPAVLVKSMQADRTAFAADILGKWMLSGRRPEQNSYKIPISSKELELLEN